MAALGVMGGCVAEERGGESGMFCTLLAVADDDSRALLIEAIDERVGEEDGAKRCPYLTCVPL